MVASSSATHNPRAYRSPAHDINETWAGGEQASRWRDDVRPLLLCLLLAVSTSSCGQINPDAFTGVQQAGDNIASAIASRTDVSHYRDLVTAYSNEMTKAEGLANSGPDRELLAQYRSIQDGLQDMLLVWEEKTQSNRELLPLNEPLSARLQKQYSLPVNTNEPPSIYATEALQMIWDETKGKLSAANDALHPPAETATRPPQ
jgi:hypothetical protein